MGGVENRELEVLRADADRNEALLRGDTEVLDRVWADELILTNARGEVHGKAQRIADIRSGALTFRTYVNDDVTVRIYNATAVLTCRFDRHLSGQGQRHQSPDTGYPGLREAGRTVAACGPASDGHQGS